MKKKTIRTVMIGLAILACTLVISDGLTYLVAALMALAIMGAIHRNRTLVMKMTRWGKTNPHKAQVFITVLQIAIMALGIITGYNFQKIGYELSTTTAFVFSSIIIIGFLFVPFLPKRRIIAIPKEVNRQRFAFMCIALSSFIMMVFFGNRIEEQYPNSPITKVVKAIDQAIFQEDANQYKVPDNEASIPDYGKKYKQMYATELSTAITFASYSSNDEITIIPLNDTKTEPKTNLKVDKKAKKFEKKKARLTNFLKKHRLAFAGMSAGLAVLLIVLLCIPLCAGICLVIGAGGGSTAGGILAGIGLIAASVFGIIKTAKARNKSKEAKP